MRKSSWRRSRLDCRFLGWQPAVLVLPPPGSSEGHRWGGDSSTTIRPGKLFKGNDGLNIFSVITDFTFTWSVDSWEGASESAGDRVVVEHEGKEGQVVWHCWRCCSSLEAMTWGSVLFKLVLSTGRSPSSRLRWRRRQNVRGGTWLPSQVLDFHDKLRVAPVEAASEARAGAETCLALAPALGINGCEVAMHMSCTVFFTWRLGRPRQGHFRGQSRLLTGFHDLFHLYRRRNRVCSGFFPNYVVVNSVWWVATGSWGRNCGAIKGQLTRDVTHFHLTRIFRGLYTK